MKEFIALIGLSREAILFDSRLYIIKSVLAVAMGYIVGKAMPIARIDMISVLLGVMYNLEAINVIGIRGGINQLVASTLGAACTGVLVALFGINVFTIAASMALTLFVSLKISWRAVSPVAIFTCIYMTQFVQLNPEGIPSIWLTFRLRIVALGIGVVIAILFNYIFSFLYYRRIAYKRLEYAKAKLLSGLEYTQKQLSSTREVDGPEYVTIFPAIFNDLDLVHSNIDIMIRESKYSLSHLQPEKLKAMYRILLYFRDINHLAYDINYILYRQRQHKLQYECEQGEILIKESIYALQNIKFTSGTMNENSFNIDNSKDFEEGNDRILSNIKSIESCMKTIWEEAAKLIDKPEINI